MKKSNMYLVVGFVTLAFAIILFGIGLNNESGGPRATITGNVIDENTLDLTESLQQTRVEINKENSDFEFEGFAIARVRSHVGNFSDWNAELILDEDGQILGMEGSIDPSSVKTGIQGLDLDLQSDNFFDVEKFPNIGFRTTNIDSKNQKISGILSFRDVEKEISFPAKITEESISANFLLDVSEFSFKYTAIENDVRISFNLSK